MFRNTVPASTLTLALLCLAATPAPVAAPTPAVLMQDETPPDPIDEEGKCCKKGRATTNPLCNVPRIELCRPVTAGHATCEKGVMASIHTSATCLIDEETENPVCKREYDTYTASLIDCVKRNCTAEGNVPGTYCHVTLLDGQTDSMPYLKCEDGSTICQ